MLITDWGNSSVPCKDEDWVWCLEPTFKKAGTVAYNPSAGSTETGSFLGLTSQPAQMNWQLPGQWETLSQKISQWVEPEKWHRKLTSNLPPHVHMCLHTCRTANSIFKYLFYSYIGVCGWVGVHACLSLRARTHAGAFRGQKRISSSRRCRQSWAIQCGP